MRVLLIGATGLLGKVMSELWQGDEFTGVGSRDADIGDQRQVDDLLGRQRPDWTVLAAAYTDVDGCEKDPELAHRVNAVGALNVARTAQKVGSKLLFVSTDYVFDGSKTSPYEPEDPISPLNVYGRTKAEGEEGIRRILPDSCIARTSWLFGANGRCFPNTILQLAQTRKKLSVVGDQRGSPTFNRDLADAIVKLVRAGAQGTVHVTNSGVCSWYEFACEIVRGAGITGVEINAVTTEEFPRPARRAKYSVLSPSSMERYGVRLRTWQDSLHGYFSDRLEQNLVCS